MGLKIDNRLTVSSIDLHKKNQVNNSNQDKNIKGIYGDPNKWETCRSRLEMTQNAKFFSKNHLNTIEHYLK